MIIDQIDFAAESFRVHTDLIIAPIVPNLTAIPLHLGNCGFIFYYISLNSFFITKIFPFSYLFFFKIAILLFQAPSCRTKPNSPVQWRWMTSTPNTSESTPSRYNNPSFLIFVLILRIPYRSWRIRRSANSPRKSTKRTRKRIVSRFFPILKGKWGVKNKVDLFQISF